MAVTKTHPIKSTLKAAIDYICNPEKTDGKLLVSSYGCAAVSARRDTAHAEIKRIESRSVELALVMKHAGTYRQLKPLYDRYRKSNDKEKFLRGHEGEIILFEAATRELKRMGAVPLPTTESMKTELANLNAEKERLLAEYKAARKG